MIKEREPALERISVIFQVILTLLCFYFILWISGFLTDNFRPENKEHLIFAFLLTPIWFGLLELFEMGAMARIQRYRHIIKKYAMIVLIGTFSLILLVELFDYQSLTTNLILEFALVNFIVLTSQKLTSRAVMKHFRRKGFNSSVKSSF